jgi:hypothetical protein
VRLSAPLRLRASAFYWDARIWVYLGDLWAFADRWNARDYCRQRWRNPNGNTICVYLRYLRFVLGWVGGFVTPWCLGVFVVKYAVPGGYDRPDWQSYAF